MYVYVHVYACLGVLTKTACYGRRLLEKRRKENGSSPTKAVKMAIADILDVPCGSVL